MTAVHTRLLLLTLGGPDKPPSPTHGALKKMNINEIRKDEMLVL